MKADQSCGVLCRSLYSMGLALRCLFVVEILLGISFFGTMLTVGYGLVLFLPLIAFSGFLLLIGEMLFWLGLVQSWQSSADSFDRKLLLAAIIAVPLPWITLVALSTAGVEMNAGGKFVWVGMFVWIAIPAFLLGAVMAWLLFAQRQSTELGDHTHRGFGVLLILTPLLAVLGFLAATSPLWLTSVVNLLQLPGRISDVITTAVFVGGVIAAFGAYPLTILGMSSVSGWRIATYEINQGKALLN